MKLSILFVLLMQCLAAQVSISQYPHAGNVITVKPNSAVVPFIAWSHHGYEVADITRIESVQGVRGTLPPTCWESVSYGSPIPGTAALYLTCANVPQGVYRYEVYAEDSRGSVERFAYWLVVRAP